VQNGLPESAWDELASHQRQENIAAQDEGTVPETFVGCEDDTVLRTTFVDSTCAAGVSMLTMATDRPRKLSDSDFCHMTSNLNRRQQYVFQFVLNWCRMKRQREVTAPFYLFCTGGAGVGKSHLIHAIVQMAIRELRQAGDNPDSVVVLLTAPTGTAAYNIGGVTLHSAFLMAASGKSRSDVLSAEKLSTLRNKFCSLQLIIIDEISMVGANLLKRVHERLASITGLLSTAPFASISILAVGDFLQLCPVGDPPIYTPSSGYVALADIFMANFKVSGFKCTDVENTVVFENA